MTHGHAALALMCRLPPAVEHACHEYLPIGAVCALQCVSRAWRARIGVAVRERFRWDIRHREGVDAPAHEWLVGVCDARVNIRTLRLVRAFLWATASDAIIVCYFNIRSFALRWFFFDVSVVCERLSKCILR